MPCFWSRAICAQRKSADLPRQRRLRLELEQLEDRLALSFGSVPPAFIIPPANAVPLALNVFGDAVGTAAITQNEIDFYSFTTPAAGPYRISALTPASNLNTVLGVYNAAGARLAFNNDISFFNRDSQLVVNLLAGAPVFVGISNLNGTPGGAYTFVVDGPAQDDSFEQNDTFAQASALGTLTEPRTLTGLVMADSKDFFAFALNAAGNASGSVSIAFQHAQGDLDLRLFNAFGVPLRISQGTTNSEQISLNGLQAGTYFVQVFGFQGAFNPSYSLTIDPGTALPPPPPPGPAGPFNIVLNLQGLTPSQALIFEQAAQRWEQIITSDLPDAFFAGQVVDDLLIDASGVPIDGPSNILGQAAPDRFRQGSFLPFHGFMEFDTADLAQLEAGGQLQSVILHEMGHVLGIGTIWQQKGLLTGAGGLNPRFTGPQATAAFNALFGTSETSVPVEGRLAGPGSADSHWRESVLNNELMTPFLNSGTNPLSRITIASLADLGYTVNLNAADAFGPGGASLVGPGGGQGTPALVQAAATVSSAALANAAMRVLGDIHQTFGSPQAAEVVFARPAANQELVADLTFTPVRAGRVGQAESGGGQASVDALDEALPELVGVGLEEGAE